MTGARVFDPRACELGEGAFWHPERRQAFWFDILGKRLLSRHQGRELSWQFDEPVSAAGWIDRDSLLIASASALFRFHLGSGARESITVSARVNSSWVPAGRKTLPTRRSPSMVAGRVSCHVASSAVVKRRWITVLSGKCRWKK